MKNVKLILLAVTAMLFLGVENVNAQEKNSVLIQYYILGIRTKSPSYIIQTVQPDYTTYQLSTKEHGGEALTELKKEIDKWLNQGYSITESTPFYQGTDGSIVHYVLVRKQE